MLGRRSHDRAAGFSRGVVSALVSTATATLCLLAATQPAGAQTREEKLPTDSVLARLIEQSLAARPELERARAVVQAQQQLVPQAAALPDPMLQVGIQNDSFDSIQIGHMETSFVSFMASQTLPWPGKLELRRKAAELGATQAEQVVARLRLSTEAEVRRAYLDLLLARDRLSLLEQLAGIWQSSLGIARVRYEAGEGAQSDVLRAQLELSRLKQRRFALLGEAQSRVQALNRLRAHPLHETIETSTHVRELPALSAFEHHFSAQLALERSPELAAARLGITRARRSVALAEKSYYPDLTVGAGVMVRGHLPAMWLLTLGGPVPVFSASKQSRAVAENRAWANVAEQEVVSLEQTLRLRSEERHTAFSTLLQTIDLYEHGLLVQSEATTQSTLSQYQVGKVTFASVLEANAGFIADQESYLESVVAAYRVLIAEAETSLNEIPMPSTTGGATTMPAARPSSMGPTSPSPAGVGAAPAAAGGASSSM